MSFAESIPYIGIMLAIISFIGYWVENIWLLITAGYMDNRNMRFPFLFGYGLLVVGMYFLFGTPENLLVFGNPKEASQFVGIIAYFILSFVIVTLSEIILGTAVEKICKTEYWNYSKIPLKITKYSSIFTSIGFALMITLFMQYLFEPVLNAITKIPTAYAYIISIALTIIMITDMIFGFLYMYRNNKQNTIWFKRFREQKD